MSDRDIKRLGGEGILTQADVADLSAGAARADDEELGQ